jgi:hypothetical protein
MCIPVSIEEIAENALELSERHHFRVGIAKALPWIGGVFEIGHSISARSQLRKLSSGAFRRCRIESIESPRCWIAFCFGVRPAFGSDIEADCQVRRLGTISVYRCGQSTAFHQQWSLSVTLFQSVQSPELTLSLGNCQPLESARSSHASKLELNLHYHWKSYRNRALLNVARCGRLTLEQIRHSARLRVPLATFTD